MKPSLKVFKENLLDRYRKVNKTTIIASTIGILFFVAILALVPSTLSNTITGDDMVFEESYPNLSTLISSPIENYTGWTARLTNIFTLNLIFGSTPDSITHLIALPLSLGLLGLSCWFFFYSLFVLLRTSTPIIFAFLISQALTLVLCLYSFATYDNFYWLAGVVTYMFPVAILNIILGCCLLLIHKNKPYRKVSLLHLLFIFIASLILGLYNEGFVVQVMSIIIAAVIIFGLVLRRSSLKGFLLLAGALFLGLVAAAAIMKFAPGTAYREQLNSSLYLVGDHSIIGLLKMTVHTTINELKTFLVYNQYGIPLVVAAVLLMSGLMGRINISKKIRYTTILFSLLLPIIAFSSLAFAVHYAYQPTITNYSLITAYYFSYLGIIGFFLVLFQIILYGKKSLISNALKNKIVIISTSIILIFSFFAVSRINQIYNLIGLQRIEFLKTNQIIIDAKKSGNTEVNLGKSYRYFTYCVPELSETAWCNNAYSQYYDLKSITVDTYVDVETQIKHREGKL